jgi:hypothetical protein
VHFWQPLWQPETSSTLFRLGIVHSDL